MTPSLSPAWHLPAVPRAVRALLVATLVACGLVATPRVEAAQQVHASTRHRFESVTPERAPVPTDADKARRKEYEVKAALLFKFLHYATFPKAAFKDKKAPLVLTVIGKDPFGDILEGTFKGKKIHGREIVVKRSKSVPKTLEGHMVFAGQLDKKQRATLVELSKNKPLLLVGEADGFAAAGALVNFYKKGRKLRFEVNTQRLEDTGLKLKAELLKLARIVKGDKSAATDRRRSR